MFNPKLLNFNRELQGFILIYPGSIPFLTCNKTNIFYNKKKIYINLF